MEPSVIATISIFGGAVLILFGWFIRSVGTKLDKKVDRLDTKIGSKIDKLDTKVGSKIDKLDTKIGSKIGTKIDKLDTKIGTKIDKLDEKVGSKIDKLDEKVGTKIDKLDTKVGTLTASVAAIAATQAEHGIMLQHMMEHGERISALEGASFGTAAT